MLEGVKSHRILTSLLVGMCLMPFVSFAAAPLDDNAMREMIHGGVTWLLHAEEKNGHFRYEYVPYEDRYLANDNIVRQAGAFYVLGEVGRRDTKNVYQLEKPLRTSLGYFEKQSVKGKFEKQTFRCVVGEEESSCQIGTTALVLVGLLDFIERYPSYVRTYLPLVHDYVSYLETMKKTNAGFRNYYAIRSNKQSEEESFFGNGEAFLALARYHLYSQNSTTKKMIIDTFTYVSKQRPFDENLYLWVMAALKDLEKKEPNTAYVSYVEDYTKWRLADRARYMSTHNSCPYMEGIASAYSVLQDGNDMALRMKLRTTLETMLLTSSGLQIKKENLYRYIEGRGIEKLGNPQKAEGGFLTGLTAKELTQRIDFTQHCVSSYVQTLIDIRGGSL